MRERRQAHVSERHASTTLERISNIVNKLKRTRCQNVRAQRDTPWLSAFKLPCTSSKLAGVSIIFSEKDAGCFRSLLLQRQQGNTVQIYCELSLHTHLATGLPPSYVCGTVPPTRCGSAILSLCVESYQPESCLESSQRPTTQVLHTTVYITRKNIYIMLLQIYSVWERIVKCVAVCSSVTAHTL